MDETDRLERVEGLLRVLERSENPTLREAARELVSTLLELHARGLRRVLALVEREPALQRKLCEDVDVERLLFLHGLHPVPLAARVEAALRALEPSFSKEGAVAELVTIDDEAVRLRFRGSAALRQAHVRELDRHAPDAGGLYIEEMPQLVQLRVKAKLASPSGERGA